MTPPLADEADLGRRVEARLHAWADALPSRCRAALDRLAARLELGPGRPGWRRYFISDTAQPVLHLPLWVGKVAADRGVEVAAEEVTDLSESAACGYLAVRLQDDWFDEGSGDPGEVMLLSGVLAARHAALMARRLAADADFWDLFQRRWQGYAEGMALERQIQQEQTPYDDELFERVLHRSRPLELPAAAGLSLWGLSDELGPHLTELVRLLVRAHQRFHDLVGAEADLRDGHRTPVTARFGGDVTRLRRRLFVEGGFDEVVAEVTDDLARAEAAAGALGSDDAARFVDGRRRLMGRVQRDAFERLFATALANKR